MTGIRVRGVAFICAVSGVDLEKGGRPPHRYAPATQVQLESVELQ